MGMDNTEIIEKLRELKPRFKELNIKSMSLFGSYARGEAGPDSDVDLLIELDGRQGFSLFDLSASRDVIQNHVGKKIDFVTRIHPLLKKRVEREKIDV
jgi:predicted nucleotidyltransferase